MVVSFVINTEYMSMAERFKWFLKNASYAKKQDYLIVTHEYIKNHLDELLAATAERFYDEFEMEHLSKEDIEALDICYIPDAMFEESYEANRHSRTAQIYQLFYESNDEIGKFVKVKIDEALKQRLEEKPEYILNMLHCFKFVQDIAASFGVPYISYSFSAMRKVHGYAQTLYTANINKTICSSDYARELYADYCQFRGKIKPIDKKKILAGLGKRRNLILLPLMDLDGKYEMGVMGEGYHTTPELVFEHKVTDDDLYYECNRFYKSGEVITRMHPMQLDQAGVGRKHMKNDPATFILSCKRLCTGHSQMILKACLWNRTPCVLSDALPFSFLFADNKFTDISPISDFDLNFILFCYCVPDSLMFEKKYWIWRLHSNPNVLELMKKHLREICKNINVDLYDSTLGTILSSRGCSNHELNAILNLRKLSAETYDFITSKIVLKYNGNSSKELYTLNEIDDDIISTSFTCNERVKQIDMFLLDDVDGFVQIDGVYVDNQYCGGADMKYYSKNSCVYSIRFSDECGREVQVKWKARKEIF